MRDNICKVLAASALMAFAWVSPLAAQSINGFNPSGPAVSPYLNLMRPASLPAINYYDLVRPQMQFQSAITNLQQNQASLIQGMTTGGAAADSPVMTGHTVMFGNLSHYYAGGAAGGGVGGGMGGGMMLPGARSLQGQRMMYSPLRGLGGMGMNQGIGGMNPMGMNPGVNSGSGRAPR